MNSTIGNTIISIAIWIVYIILPVATIINGTITILHKKKIIQNQGKRIFKIKPDISFPFPVLILLTVTFFSLLVYSVIQEEILIFLFSLIFMQLSISWLQKEIFRDASGVYENGIILSDEPIEWKSIHSYDSISENKISFLMESGLRIDTPELDNVKEISSFLSSKELYSIN